MKVSLRAAVENFDSGQFYDLEHGITDEEAAQGLRDTFTSIGVEWDEDCLFYCGSLTTSAEEAERVAQAKKRAEKHAIWAKAHPEEAALQESVERQLEITRMALRDRVMDEVFRPSQIFPWMLQREPEPLG